MNLDNFIVRPARRYVQPFQARERWNHLSQSDVADLRRHVAGLPSQLPDDSESAKQFDLLVLNLQLAQQDGRQEMAARLRERIVDAAGALQGVNVPLVQARAAVLRRVQTDEFWQDVTLPALEDLRADLRDITRFIDRESRAVLETDFQDELGEVKPGYLPAAGGGVNREQYKKKVEQFLRDHRDEPVIRKIHLAEPLTIEDLAELDRFFYDGGAAASKEFVQVYGRPENLAAFVRGLVGLDRRAAKQRFAAFLDQQVYTADQIEFVNHIINYLTENGAMEPGLLYEQPFTDVHHMGPEGLFTQAQATDLFRVLQEINQT
jgi:type I restriction enzyme R subunit